MKSITSKKILKYIGVAVFLSLIVIFFLFPFIWLVLTSIKTRAVWGDVTVWIPDEPTIYNYLVVLVPHLALDWEKYSIGMTNPITTSLINSIIIAGGGALVALVIGSLGAYSISRYRVGKGMFFMVLMTRMYPGVAIAVPLLVQYTTLKLIDTYHGMIILYTGFGVAYVIWMMKGFIDEIPVEIEEAAMIDGCSKMHILFRIIFPLVAGGLGACFLFIFILNWSEFAYALIFTRQNITLPVQMNMYWATSSGMAYGPLSAAGVIAVIPLIIFGYAIQRYLVRGLTFGAVKA